MVRKLVCTLAIILASSNSFSQENNEFLFYYGTSDSKMLRNQDLDGTGSMEVTSFSEFGFRYLGKINKHLSLETGLNYSKADLELTPAFMGEPVQSRGEEFELISIPVYVSYTLWNYVFIHAGPLLDFQLSENTTDSQSGIGYGLGLGGKFNFNNIVIYLNPNFKRHAVIPFEKENYHQRLTEFGVQLGLGYKF